MDRGGVGDKRGSKEMDRCPLTVRVKMVAVTVKMAAVMVKMAAVTVKTTALMVKMVVMVEAT
jgi:hypothetical protein